MTPDDDLPRLECPIDVFDAAEGEIRQLSRAINRVSPSDEKARLAHQLSDRVHALLACSAYDRADENCRLCHEISTLRGKTASLIGKATALDRRRTAGGAGP